jgi:very-short-patch-repair endonuclease
VAHQILHAALWALVRVQHGVVTRGQLLKLGYSAEAIKHRIAIGRLHVVYRGVYAVGRPELSREGRWMAAVLACGLHAVLSHLSAAALWQIGSYEDGRIDVALPAAAVRRRSGISVHRRRWPVDHLLTRHNGIPVTNPLLTLVDLASVLQGDDRLQAAVNEADKRGLIDPETLRSSLDELPAIPGVARLRTLLDRATFVLTESKLERYFLPIARAAGLPKPITQEWVNGGRVDFYWPDLGLVVETDGLTYHRTPAQQAKDRRRDQAHTAAGLTPLRFTHAQVRFEPRYVQSTLEAVAERLV